MSWRQCLPTNKGFVYSSSALRSATLPELLCFSPLCSAQHRTAPPELGAVISNLVFPFAKEKAK